MFGEALIALVLIKGLIFLSCATYKSFQVMETESTDATFKDGKYLSENNDIELSYDFWNNAPNMYFSIFNKTDKPLYVDFDRSHLILNGQSFDYYQDLEEVSSISTSKKVSNYYGYGHASSSAYQSQNTKIFKRKRIIEIPPKSFITFRDNVNLTYSFDNCEAANVKKGAPYIASFEENNSPFKFRNYISYCRNADMQNIEVLENSFWMSKLSIVSENDFKTNSTEKTFNCSGGTMGTKMVVYPYESPKNIYCEFKHNPNLLTFEKSKNAQNVK